MVLSHQRECRAMGRMEQHIVICRFVLWTPNVDCVRNDGPDSIAQDSLWRCAFDGTGRTRKFLLNLDKRKYLAFSHTSAVGRFCCKTIFDAGTKNIFLAPRSNRKFLIHRTGHSDSSIAKFHWPGRSSGTFATISAISGHLSTMTAPRSSLQLPAGV